jgi:alpha-D-xyloside xylohydrolase
MQTLAIGQRSGKFPGMLKERTFRVVFVSPGHGAGPGEESHADAVIRYTGKAMTVTCGQ